MPDFLRVFERTAKATRSLFGHVGSLVDRTLPPEVAFLVDAAKKTDEDDALAEFYRDRRLYALGPDGKTLMFEPGDWYLGPPAVGATAGTDPEAVSAGSPTTAPASGLSLATAADFFPQHTKTSAEPPTAVDDPAEVPPASAGSPLDDWDVFSLKVLATATARADAYRTSLLREAGIDVEALDEDREFDWAAWVQPAICDVLAEHRPTGQPDGRVFCPDGTYTARHYASWAEWREHVAPLIAERIHEAAAGQQ